MLSRLAAAGPTDSHRLAVVRLRAAGLTSTPAARTIRSCEPVAAGQVLLGPMSDQELRETILYPAQTRPWNWSRARGVTLLADLGRPTTTAATSPDVFRCWLTGSRTTWQQRHDHVLTVAGYQNTGASSRRWGDHRRAGVHGLERGISTRRADTVPASDQRLVTAPTTPAGGSPAQH